MFLDQSPQTRKGKNAKPQDFEGKGKKRADVRREKKITFGGGKERVRRTYRRTPQTGTSLVRDPTNESKGNLYTKKGGEGEINGTTRGGVTRNGLNLPGHVGKIETPLKFN